MMAADNVDHSRSTDIDTLHAMGMIATFTPRRKIYINVSRKKLDKSVLNLT